MKQTLSKKPFHFSLGRKGEAEAARFLVAGGFRILEKNYRCPLGEIDIIAQKNSKISFIEVKTRRTDDFGRPEEAVDRQKQKKLTQIALWYLKENKKLEASASFAVIGISWKGTEDPEICFTENAFQVMGGMNEEPH